jgi:bacterial/archaeal transporter family-2 protein
MATWGYLSDSPLSATLVSFVVGAVALFVAVLAFARGWPGSERIGSAPWWVWVGGLLGAFYVLGSIVTAPRLGAATLVAGILAGQAVASLLVNHFGWVGFDENPITPGRLAGMGLVAAGVVLVASSNVPSLGERQARARAGQGASRPTPHPTRVRWFARPIGSARLRRGSQLLERQ